jgi:hypothetical protein
MLCVLSTSLALLVVEALHHSEQPPETNQGFLYNGLQPRYDSFIGWSYTKQITGMLEVRNFCPCDAPRSGDPVPQTCNSLRPRRFKAEYQSVSCDHIVYIYCQSRPTQMDSYLP